MRLTRYSAAITITAADPDGLQANQGFNVTVGQDGVKHATVAIFGLRNVEDRSKSINPTNVSGDIAVILDVQNNDETVKGIGLTLNDEEIQCRGDIGADLAASSGQIEVDCFLDTNAVDGACVGMQLEPRYANGEYNLGAFIITSEDERREVVAMQPITLKNSGYVMIAHEAGEMSVVSNTTKGLTFHGGPAAEGNVNSFHACPVSYTGTTVGEMTLGAIHTNTARPAVATDPQPGYGSGNLSLRRSRSGSHAPADKEAPFTWPVSTASWSGNAAVENAPGVNEFWIENRGLIKNADGLDVTGEFRAGETHKAGPFQFDFSAPRVNQDGDSEVVVSLSSAGSRRSRSVVAGEYFSDGTALNTPTRLQVSNVVEGGVGEVSEIIAVGDCSVAANTDNRSSTAFVALFDDIRNISDLPENDSQEDVGDDGVDCYTAELQALTDALGNSRSLGNIDRIQTAGSFGVDHGAPTYDEVEPEQGAVLSFASTSTTQVYLYVQDTEDPDLETGEDGSGVFGATPQRRISGSWRTQSGITATPASRSFFRFTVTGLDDGSHTMRALLWDNANPGNVNVVPMSFIKDTKAPTFTSGAGPGAVNAGSSAQITVTASGTIRDANVIDEAVLSVYANNGSPHVCGGADSADERLPDSRADQLDLENDTKTIEFEQAMTIKRPPAGGGAENLCFHLSVKDVATDEEGDDDGANTAVYSAGNFSVNWGLGMTIAADAAGGGNTLNSAGALRVSEDGTAVSVGGTEYGNTGTFTLKLDAQPASAVRVTITGHGGSATTNDSTFWFASTADQLATLTDAGAATATLWSDSQTVTVTGAEDARTTANPEDAANEAATLTLTAAGGGYAGITGSVPVTVYDNDVRLTVSDHDISVGDTVTVTVTATLANAIPATGSDRSVSVEFTDGTGAAATGVSISAATVTIPVGATSGTADVQVEAAGAGVSSGTITVGGGSGAPDQVPATITIKAASG